MKTRMIYTRFWHDNYISKLNPKEKLLFIYLITNEKVNICGIYELPDKYIKFDLGLRQIELDKIKQKFMENGKFLFIDGWVKILNYERYNRFLGEKNEKAKENELALIPVKIREFIYPIDGVSTNGDTPSNQLVINNHNKLVINKTPSLIKEIITYLNEKTGKAFEPETIDTQKLIKARLKEGNDIRAFKWVIDRKSAEWKNKFLKDGTPMENWLKPETLFGNKFEGYLNQFKYNKKEAE